MAEETGAGEGRAAAVWAAAGLKHGTVAYEARRVYLNVQGQMWGISEIRTLMLEFRWRGPRTRTGWAWTGCEMSVERLGGRMEDIEVELADGKALSVPEWIWDLVNVHRPRG